MFSSFHINTASVRVTEIMCVCVCVFVCVSMCRFSFLCVYDLPLYNQTKYKLVPTCDLDAGFKIRYVVYPSQTPGCLVIHTGHH